jgi:uncharacterized membrane protein
MHRVNDIPNIRLCESMDAVEELLLEIRTAILMHPTASQAIFRSLITEGRRFAATDEGAEKLHQLRRSKLVQRARLMLENIAGWQLNEDPADSSPSDFINALFFTAENKSVEEVLQRVQERTMP